MKNLFPGLFLLLSIAFSSAAETVAWKCPLANYAHHGMDSEGIARLEKPPEPSPFFKPGDELWDLSAVPEDTRFATSPPPEWIVWNATSGRIVTKANLNAIWQLDLRIGRDNMPTQCRVTAEIFPVPADGAPLSSDAVPACSLSWITRSGQKSDCETVTKDGTIRVKAEMVTSDFIIDGRIHATCSLPGKPVVEMISNFVFADGVPLWVARNFNGTDGLDIRLTAYHELTDGSPFSEASLIIRNGKAVSLNEDRDETKVDEIEGGGWLGTSWFPAGDLASLTGKSDQPAVDPDPFSDTSPRALPDSLGLEWVEAPDRLKPWFPEKVFDLADVLERSGLVVKKNSGFAGYDPLTQRIFMFSLDRLEVDKFEQLFTAGCQLSPAQIIITARGEGMTRLIARSGFEASLLSGDVEKKPGGSFKVEPVIGMNDDLIDLRLSMNEKSVAGKSHAVETSMTLRDGVPLEFMAEGDGKKTISAEIIRVRPPQR